MKKTWILITILLISVLAFSACSKQNSDTKDATDVNETETKTDANNKTEADDKTEDTTVVENADDENQTADAALTIIYESEEGPIEVPADPKRIVVLNSFVSGSVMAFDTDIVGVDSWAMANPRYAPFLEEAVEVSDQGLEKIIELNPDLIIAAPTNNNIDKLKQIAPTVVYTYGKVDYLTQILEVGKLLNRGEEAQAWIDDFKARAQKAGEDVKAVIGDEATISVVESFEKQLYVFGDNWGRGTEIIYQEMKLNMPEKVKEMALEAGYYALSPEVLPEYAGDYVIFSKNASADNSFQETETYQNIPAVKNNRVFEFDAAEFYFNDPITLDYQLQAFTDYLLGSE
ncbi:ABC transporter substrate-binding protein [Mobilitalea sibirica]|uniref:ABC transporter substrate-binding protein n=1 Tax=Mobilitalea sibirica TaxID=1462919 RepID=A0A8J7GZM9_9FIRM|nr:iron-hydroxamate ABC transporter substrate-binding protein [Mobilitalea sibirica]MBH1941379.1 ABC transporter substrate-binding protein [Mobilitalea sibirica]